MSSLLTSYALGSLHACPGSFSRSLIPDDLSLISGDLMWGECFAPPSPNARRMPQVLKSRGMKHSPPGDKFQKSGDLPVSGPEPSEIQISKVKSYSNEAFSIPTNIFFNVDSDCVHPRFQFRPHMLSSAHISCRIMRILRISSSWHQVLWSLAVSNDIPGDSWCFNKFPHVSWFIFKNIGFWWFRMDFLCSHARKVLRTPFPSARGSAPS